MTLRRPDLGTFEKKLLPALVRVSTLVRLSRSPATEPYWSIGRCRFDDPAPGRPDSFGICYTAASIPVAFSESVIHESGLSRAIHDAHPKWDGIRYISRQMNVGYVYAVFNRSGLAKVNADRLEGSQLDQLCDQFNVVAI